MGGNLAAGLQMVATEKLSETKQAAATAFAAEELPDDHDAAAAFLRWRPLLNSTRVLARRMR